jgi:penicillin amidase
MKQIVLDDYFDSADYILPILFSEIGCYEASLLPEEKKALELLKKWDRRGKVNESGAAIFSEFRVSLATEIFLDEMGADRFKSIADTSRIHHYLKKVTNNPNSKWWDDRKTQTVETRKEIIYRSFIATVAILLGKQGTNLQEWKWGNMHTLTLKHPLGEVPPLNHLFNSGPRVANGGTETVNNMLARLSNNNHAVIAGPSMRTLIDFMDTEHIQIINPLGQSAHRFSPHFQDQADMFVQGKFRILNLSEMKTKDESRILSMLPK